MTADVRPTDEEDEGIAGWKLRKRCRRELLIALGGLTVEYLGQRPEDARGKWLDLKTMLGTLIDEIDEGLAVSSSEDRGRNQQTGSDE